MSEIVCKNCGATKKVPPSQVRAGRKYCSSQCAVEAMKGSGNPNWKGGLVEKICKVCGKTFAIKRSQIGRSGGSGTYCSKECRITGESRPRPERYRRVTKHCKVCGKELSIKQSHVDVEGTYCSRECQLLDYKTTFGGENNPNYKGGFESKCPVCGRSVHIYPREINRQNKFCSRSCSMVWRSMHTEFSYEKRRNIKSGKREDLGGRYFRSAWEANYARYLNWLVAIGEIAGWEYEVESFEFPVKRGNMRYLPDFRVTNNDGTFEYHEVKGHMDDDSRVKLTRMEKYYPDKKLVLIDAPVYRAIQKQAKSLIPNWE